MTWTTPLSRKQVLIVMLWIGIMTLLAEQNNNNFLLSLASACIAAIIGLSAIVLIDTYVN